MVGKTPVSLEIFGRQMYVKEGALIFVFSIALYVGLTALADNKVNAAILTTPVASYSLDCDETFSCPESLLPRVDFWIEVFSRWDTNTAIFHDKENPHRVYSTVTREDGCRRSRKGDSIDRERRRLKKSLTTIAARLKNSKSLSTSQQKLYAMFSGESIAEIRAAASRVRCQSGNQNRMREALSQFKLYRPTILDALESQNLTPELQYLPFVESAFNPKALSHVGAAGLWQIMPATGRTLGLKVNRKVDERYDPKSATYAAALYFRNSVDDLSDTAFENGYSVAAKDLNPFVITSYNYGVRGMQRAIKQVGLDYERLLLEYKSPNFQTAVKNFYASFLAARHVAKNPDMFFGEVETDQSERIHSFNNIKLKYATSAKRVASILNVDTDDLKQLNPSLTSLIWRNKGLIPESFDLKLPYRELGWDTALAKMYLLPREIERSGYQWHRVRSGQTACGIAEKYGASCRALRKLNKLNSKGTIYVGKRIKVPTKTGGISVLSNTLTTSAVTAVDDSSLSNSEPIAESTNPNAPSTTQRYRVRRGDTSCSIANSFGMLCSEFLAINGLTRDSVIRAGQNVMVSALNKWHRVSSGQTACQIAELYRVGCSALLNANRLNKKSIITVGQRLRIPSRG